MGSAFHHRCCRLASPQKMLSWSSRLCSRPLVEFHCRRAGHRRATRRLPAMALRRPTGIDGAQRAEAYVASAGSSSASLHCRVASSCITLARVMIGEPEVPVRAGFTRFLINPPDHFARAAADVSARIASSCPAPCPGRRPPSIAPCWRPSTWPAGMIVRSA